MFQKSLLAVVAILFAFVSVTDANLRKGRIEAGDSLVFEFSTNDRGFSTLVLIFDNANTDLDLGIADLEGDLISVGFSEQRHLELLQAGLPEDDTFLIVVDSFRGGGLFRLVVNNSEQGTIGAAGVESEGALKQITMTSAARKVRDQMRALAAKHKQ